MKEVFVSKSFNLIQAQYNYNQDDQDRIRYGLEIIYITLTKLFAILFTSLIFGTLKETIIFCLFATGLRTFSYGIHAKKSWHCYVSSLIVFVLFPYIVISFNLTYIAKIIISVFTIISMALFAPADTHKRPIVNSKMRKTLKIKSLVITSLYILIIFISNYNKINNLIMLSMMAQSIVINPITYKIFKLPYNNYKEYIN